MGSASRRPEDRRVLDVRWDISAGHRPAQPGEHQVGLRHAAADERLGTYVELLDLTISAGQVAADAGVEAAGAAADAAGGLLDGLIEFVSGLFS